MILELKNIEKSFGEKKVLTGVSFKAEGGKAFGLLGRNGAGKTTSIRILMDVFPANSGEVLMDGKPIDYRKVGIGYLPEERGLYPKKTIIDQLAYFAELNVMEITGKDNLACVDNGNAVTEFLDIAHLMTGKQDDLPLADLLFDNIL